MSSAAVVWVYRLKLKLFALKLSLWIVELPLRFVTDASIRLSWNSFVFAIFVFPSNVRNCWAPIGETGTVSSPIRILLAGVGSFSNKRLSRSITELPHWTLVPWLIAVFYCCFYFDVFPPDCIICICELEMPELNCEATFLGFYTRLINAEALRGFTTGIFFRVWDMLNCCLTSSFVVICYYNLILAFC